MRLPLLIIQTTQQQINNLHHSTTLMQTILPLRHTPTHTHASTLITPQDLWREKKATPQKYIRARCSAQGSLPESASTRLFLFCCESVISAQAEGDTPSAQSDEARLNAHDDQRHPQENTQRHYTYTEIMRADVRTTYINHL